jgi:hypothetical protein
MRVSLCSPVGKEIASRSDDIVDRQRANPGSSSDRRYHAAAFSGLPVAAEVIIRAKGRARPSDSIIRSVYQPLTELYIAIYLFLGTEHLIADNMY